MYMYVCILYVCMSLCMYTVCMYMYVCMYVYLCMWAGGRAGVGLRVCTKQSAWSWNATGKLRRSHRSLSGRHMKPGPDPIVGDWR